MKIKKIRTIVFLLILTTILSMLPVSSATNLSISEEPIISDRLSKELDKHSSEKIDVNIWFKDSSQYEISKLITEKLGMTEAEWKLSVSDDTPIEEIHAFKKMKAEISSKVYTKNNTALAKKHLASEEITYISKYSPSVLATLSANKIRSIATKSNDILNIDLYSDEVVECAIAVEDYTIEEMAAKINELPTSYTGEGINIGIFDIEVPNQEDILSCAYMGHYGSNTSQEGGELSHAEKMANIIIDIAPDANYYFAGGEGGTVFEFVEWMVNHTVDVINISMRCGQELSEYTNTSKWFDHISYQHYITVVAAVGNKLKPDYIELTLLGEAQMAYNPIAVGAIDVGSSPNRYNDDKQGSSTYSTETSYSVPFKPDICAPYGDSSSSAALVTGVVALLMCERNSLIPYPETIKSILTACVNTISNFRFLPKDRSTNTQIDSYMKFGAGLIDAYLTLTCAISGNYVQDLMLSSDTTKTYTFTVTNTNPVRISLAFLQPVEITSSNHIGTSNLSNHAKIDLDLSIRSSSTSTQYCYSSTSANNIEIVTFTPPAPGTYTIRVSRFGEQSESVDAWYGIAWHQE